MGFGKYNFSALMMALSVVFLVTAEASPAATAKVFKQNLDHFSNHDHRQFTQRYFVSSKYVIKNPEQAPVLLYLCAEWVCSFEEADRIMSYFARDLGAHIVAIEHRYYGRSSPFKLATTKNFKFLTVQQALADVNSIQIAIKKQLKLNGRWIVSGGSYAGMLSTYYRTLYPDQVVGAWASSAPIKSFVTMKEYDRHSARVFGKTCATSVQVLIRDIEQSIGTSAINPHRDAFGLEPEQPDTAILDAISSIELAAQFGEETKVCDAIKKSGAEAGIIEYLSAPFQRARHDTDTEGILDSGVVWQYQICSQMGFMPSAFEDPNQSLMSRVNTSLKDVFTWNCDKFGINQFPDVAAFNKFFFEAVLLPSTTQIVFTHGTHDPWYAMSPNPENGWMTNPNLITIVYEGAAHCDDMDWPESSAELIAGRKKILKLFNSWVLNK